MVSIVRTPPLITAADRALHLDDVLDAAGITSKVGTPCGILAPLWRLAQRTDRSASLVTMSREDTALAFAVGQALSGIFPAVLMQNSGFGNCINVMASLVCPFEIRMVLIVSLRGTDNDSTPENSGMGTATAAILKHWKIPSILLRHSEDRLSLADINPTGPTVVLIGPEYFGWRP